MAEKGLSGPRRRGPGDDRQHHLPRVQELRCRARHLHAMHGQRATDQAQGCDGDRAVPDRPLVDGMSESKIVNALVETLDNHPGPAREPSHVGRLLAGCQRCSEWSNRGCTRIEWQAWIRILIEPARGCNRW